LRLPTARGVTLLDGVVPSLEAFDQELRPVTWFSPANPWPERSQRILDLINDDTALTPPRKAACTALVKYYQTYGGVYGCRRAIWPVIVLIVGSVCFLLGRFVFEDYFITLGIWMGSWVIGFVGVMFLARKKRLQWEEMKRIKAEIAQILHTPNNVAGFQVVRGGGMIVRM
jgi:hypothetical protein